MVRLASLLVLACLWSACSQDRLSNEQLSAVVDAQRGSLDACYDAALQKQPLKDELRGQAVLAIAASGEVDSVEIEGELPLEGLDACLRKAIGAWTFPAAGTETRTTLPLIFEPRVEKTQQNVLR